MRIGIVTHYYENYNYGGNLQAFALCHYLNKLPHVCAEQIPCRMAQRSFLQKLSFGKLMRAPQKLYRKLRERSLRAQDDAIRPSIFARCAAIRPFNAAIPHAEAILDPAVLPTDDGGYDLYITGSDQVWNPDACTPLYRLDFVREGATKISYAASVSRGSLTGRERAVMAKSLADFHAVSVRESNAVGLLADLSPVPVEWVLDPVFLLSRAEWENVAEPREERAPYLFCYFLGGETSARRAAEGYARAHNLRIVTLPYLEGKYRPCDADFGDERLFDVSPSRLLSLIRDAQCVFTDSFHALAFASIFERAYFVFDRENGKSMESRLTSLLQMLGGEARFLHKDAEMTPVYMDTLEKPHSLDRCKALQDMKARSIAFLDRFVQGGEE